MKTTQLWLVASACSLLLLSVKEDARAERAMTAYRRGTAALQKERHVAEAPARSGPRGVLRLPRFLVVGAEGRGNGSGFARFAAAPKRAVSVCRERCTDPRAPDRTMARTSRALVAAAAASVAAGVVVVLARPTKPERGLSVPMLKLRLSAERAIASAGWRF